MWIVETGPRKKGSPGVFKVDRVRLLELVQQRPDATPAGLREALEMVFSKVKQLLRTLALRTQDALWNSMQSVLGSVSPSDAANCFTHAGYATCRMKVL